jgi:hypothetical protein
LQYESGAVRLIDATQEFSRKVQQLVNAPPSSLTIEEWKLTVSHLNKGLWDHVELLEGIVVELFQQVDQMGIELWRPEIMEVIETIKKMLMQSFQQLIWAIRQLETDLGLYRSYCKSNVVSCSLLNWIPFRSGILDRNLLSNALKNEKFLNFRFQALMQLYEQYEQMNMAAEDTLKKFDTYQVFTTFELDFQKNIKQIYRLLKLWEINRISKGLPQREPIRALRNVINAEKALQLFNGYVEALKNSLFKRSRYLKRSHRSLDDQVNRLVQLQAIVHETVELHTLGVTVTKYRDFLLRTDPNPYVRTRWGFSEWIVGPEPAIPKKLRKVEFDIEALDVLYGRLRKVIEDWVGKTEIPPELDEDIQRTLHEMGQPLTSQSMMKVRAEHFLSLLAKVNELGSTDPKTVEYTGLVLSRAMRADWKHHALYDISLFHDLYEIHKGIIGEIEDRAHFNRQQKFKRYIQQIQQWVKERDLQRHSHEIEFDINDIKGYLQDFLAQVQNFNRDLASETQEKAIPVIENIAQQLLEYRYLFGNFFHHLRETDNEEKLIRNQFLFVDQYFESVESLLHDMRRFPYPENMQTPPEAPSEET